MASKVNPEKGNIESEGSSCVVCLAEFFSFLVFLITFPIAIFVCFEQVPEYKRAVIFRLGRIRGGGARGPGLFFTLPCFDEFRNIDLRTAILGIPAQAILSKDSVTVIVHAVAYARIFDPIASVLNVASCWDSTKL